MVVTKPFYVMTIDRHLHFSVVDIDVPSAVEVFTTLRYINVHLLT